MLSGGNPSRTDGSSWYQIAGGEGRGAFYDAPEFSGSITEAAEVASAFPGAAEGTTLRTVAMVFWKRQTMGGSTLWYNSAYYEEPEAPHTVMQSAGGVDWYAMQQQAEAPIQRGQLRFCGVDPLLREACVFADGCIIAGQGSKRRELRRAVGHWHGRVLFGDMVRQVQDRVVFSRHVFHLMPCARRSWRFARGPLHPPPDSCL